MSDPREVEAVRAQVDACIEELQRVGRLPDGPEKRSAFLAAVDRYCELEQPIARARLIERFGVSKSIAELIEETQRQSLLSRLFSGQRCSGSLVPCLSAIPRPPGEPS